jgi:predicted phage tail protein
MTVVSHWQPADYGPLPAEAESADVLLTFISMYRRATYTHITEETAVAIQIFHRVALTDQWLPATEIFEVMGKSRSRYNRRFSIQRPPDSAGQEWDVRVQRITKDPDQWTHNRFYLHSVTPK